jgi:hypothetical protein
MTERERALYRHHKASIALGHPDCYGFCADLTPRGKTAYARWLKADDACDALGISQTERFEYQGSTRGRKRR